MPEPKIAQKGPYVLNTEEGTYIWCGCGLSKTQPFCDNSHKGTEYHGQPGVAMRVDVEEEEAGKLEWCGCKHTKTPPFCDGTHTKL